MRDQIFRDPQSQIVDFAFGADVAAVFPDMIRRSVPGYETVIPMTGLLAARHLGNKGKAFDLGCSLGATTLAVLSQTDSADVRVVGVDSSEPMIERAQELVTDSRASFECTDIRDVDLDGADVVILNFVLQFLPPEDRAPWLAHASQQMADGGMLLISEKVTSNEHYEATHLAWKKANGYSDLEISQKRSALENVMKIDSEDVHFDRLAAAGFSDVSQWYRCLNWAGFVARKRA